MSERERGVDAGARNIGRFFLFAIPLALGMAASTWLGFYVATHDFRRQLSQEDRAAIAVGAEERPTAKIAVNIGNQSCVRVMKADLDGSRLAIYTRNDCQRVLSYVAWHYEVLSPNGTVLHHGYNNTAICAAPSQPGDMAECVFGGDSYGGVEIDDRTASVRVWATDGYR